jgi:FHA domain
MPPDQHVNPAEEPSPRVRAYATFMPSAFRDPGSPVRIGRRPNNDIVISDLGVSKQHAELRPTTAGRYTIIDLGSHAGTYVNGARVSQQELNEGDIIAIGLATFRLAGGKLIESVAAGADTGSVADGTDEEAQTALQREQDLTAELRRRLDARGHRIDALEAALRALAAENPAVLPVLDRLGIRPAPEA